MKIYRISGEFAGLRDLKNLDYAKPQQSSSGGWYFGGGKCFLNLKYVKKDGSPISQEDANSIASLGPNLAGVKTRIFPTEEEALIELQKMMELNKSKSP